ncbi:hypothetical protein A235_23508, partial [Pseudomonas syringae pv. actinidiae ICMP 19079]
MAAWLPLPVRVISKVSSDAVQAVDGFHREALEQTVFDHALRAAKVFLGRLKDKVNRTGEPAGFRQVPGSGEQDRRV